MTLLAVSAIGADRPGIVAAVTGVLVEAGANLEDTSMTILRGHFAMTLVVAAPVAAADLEQRLAPVAEAMDLVVTVRELAPEPAQHQPAHPFVLSVYGADHPGIVHRVTALLAAHEVNITDLATRLVGDDAPLYTMVLELDVPESVQVDQLEAALAEVAAELDVDTALHPADPDLF